MRRQGKSVLFVHDSGKNGGQRGSSKHEDILDVVIHLTKSENYTPDHGARFEVHFEKFRNGFRDVARPIEARLTETADGSAVWDWEYLRSGEDEIIRLLSLGHSQAEVCNLVNKHKSTVSRAAARARAEGKLPAGAIERRV